MHWTRLRSFSTTMWNYLYDNGRIWQCYDFISPTCDPWQRRFLSAPFYAHPIIRFYTINYIPLLFLLFTPFPPRCLIHGWYSDRPTLWCALHHLLPSQIPIFMSQTHQKGCTTHRFYNSHMLHNRVLEVCSRVRDQGCNVVHLPPILCPRLQHGSLA